jgi:hypothetical protein
LGTVENNDIFINQDEYDNIMTRESIGSFIYDAVGLIWFFFIFHGQAKRVPVQQNGPLNKIKLVGWLVEFVGWIIDWLNWLGGWLIELVGWLNWLVDWLNWLAVWLVELDG